MKRRFLSKAKIITFREHLILEEKSEATIGKYMRDTIAFLTYTQGREITRKLVIAYKKQLQDCYAARSVNSMLASLNSLFSFLHWHDLKLKSMKFQQPIYCSEEKELTKVEYMRLCKTAELKKNRRLSLILQTICGTGIRVSELRFVTVEAVRGNEITVDCKAKTRKVFIVKRLKQKLLNKELQKA